METAVRERSILSGDGTLLALYHFGGSGRPVLLVHATGFCGAVLAPLAAALLGGAHRTAPRSGALSVFGIDLRGHGHAAASPDADYRWDHFADDVLAAVGAIAEECEGRPIGFGHSCGGTALVLAEQARRGSFQELYLFEPILWLGSSREDGNIRDLSATLSAGALRRRATFRSRSEALAHFAARPPLSNFDRDALVNYVEHGLRDLPGGGVELACAPAQEAAIYRAGPGDGAFSRLGELDVPTTFAYGTSTVAVGGDASAKLAAACRRATVAPMRGLTHFAPMESPKRVASSLAATIAGRDPALS
jgi:pimeloyl-ACP methyl ester carboxylesterase